MEYDVFVSYPHADTAAVKPIISALHGKGLRVWHDESGSADYASISRCIRDGLARSKALLAYYSRNYTDSRACQWALTAAFLAAQHEGDPRRRVLVINPETRADHIHPLELRNALFQKTPEPGNGEAYDRLAEGVQRHVSTLKGLLGDTLTSPTWYGWEGIGSNRFVGRLPELWQIHAGLAEVPSNAAGSPLVQIYGRDGMGKSLLAEEYALRFGPAYPGGVFWLRVLGNGDSNDDELEVERNQQVREIADCLGIPIADRSPEEIKGHLGRELGHRGQPFLWVVDDAPTMDAQSLRRWFAPHPLGKTLIVMHSRECDGLGKLLPLGVLEPDDAYRLLTSRHAPVDAEAQQAARAIARDLGYHALAVDMAGGILGYQLFDQLQRELADPDVLGFVKKLTGNLPNGCEKRIADLLLKSITLLGEAGQDFLRLAAVLAAAPIPVELMASVFARSDGLTQGAARYRAALAFRQAEELSLAKSISDRHSSLTVHPLVSRTVRVRDTCPERRAHLKATAVQVLNAVLPRGGRTHRELEPWITHGRELTAAADDLDTAELLGWVARDDLERGDYRAAAKRFEQQLAIHRRLLGDEHPRTLDSMHKLSSALARVDLRLHEQALTTRPESGEGPAPRRPKGLLARLASVWRWLRGRV